MPIQIELRLSPENATKTAILEKEAAQKLGLKPTQIKGIQVVKRSIDARFKRTQIIISMFVYVNEPPLVVKPPVFQLQNVKNARQIIIIGAGPAGLFAALRLIELGLCPIVLERGKDVRSRRRDLAKLNRERIVNQESNYCFGEGGAGTYSDGKLYTRSKKRGSVRHILELLVAHGADDQILVEAHPHIGTNKLPQVITAIRESILEAGGVINFGTKVVDFQVEANVFNSVLTDKNEKIKAESVILATGHSARDIYHWFYNNNFAIEAKSFAMGVRVEHPQSLIDQIQYKCGNNGRGEFLPPAAYRIARQVAGNKKYKEQRGVYSFCMCPGGVIAPCATAPGELVTNGWSPSRRNNPFANSGVVVALEGEDFRDYKQYGPLAGLHYQAAVEKRAWEAGGKNQTAPAQRLIDFVEGRVSSDLPNCSYYPGIVSTQLSEVLPSVIDYYLKQGLKLFGKKMKNYYTNEAVVVAVESRTSSPVRIPRDKESLEHPEIVGLYPCGEGAGYAGGIVSAAIDGMRCAEMAASRVVVS